MLMSLAALSYNSFSRIGFACVCTSLACVVCCEPAKMMQGARELGVLLDSLPWVRPALLPCMRKVLDPALAASMEDPKRVGHIAAITLGTVGSCELLLSAGIMAKSQTLQELEGGGVGNVLCVIEYEVVAGSDNFVGQVRRRNKCGGITGSLLPIVQEGNVDRSACAEFRALGALTRLLSGLSGQARGSVTLSVTEPPCLSCLSAMLQFRMQHPQLRMEAVIDGSLMRYGRKLTSQMACGHRFPRTCSE